MANGKDALAELNAHERECAIRYEYIEKRLDEGSAKFKRLEMLLWGVYPFILGSIVFATFI
jgi:hypothetical protein